MVTIEKKNVSIPAGAYTMISRNNSVTVERTNEGVFLKGATGRPIKITFAQAIAPAGNWEVRAKLLGGKFKAELTPVVAEQPKETV